MATTVATYPSSTSAIARTSATTWTNTGNIVSDDATDATCSNTTGAGSYYLVASGFGFAIPSGRIITGITVVVQASEHSTSTEVLYAQLQNASGALFGGSKTATLSGTSKVNYTYGSRTDLWSATLTADIINDPNFGVRVWFTTSHSVRIDFIRMTVEYGDEITLAAPSDLTLGGYPPSLSSDSIIAPGAGEITAEGYAPTVERSSEDVRVSFARLSILTTDVRVSYARLDTLQTTNIVPGIGALVVVSDPVTVDQTTSRTITAGLGEVAVTGYPPQVFAGDFIYIGTGALPVLGFSPTVAQTANHFAALGLGEVTATGYTPNLQGNYNISPDVGALAAEGFAPSVGQDKLITAGAGTVTVAGYAPFVVNGATDVRFSYARLDTQNNVRAIGLGELTVTGYPPAIGALVLGGGGYRTVPWIASVDEGVTGYWFYYDTASRGDDNYLDYRYSVWVPGRTTESYTVSGLIPYQFYYFNISSDGGDGTTHTAYESELYGEYSAEALDGSLIIGGHAPITEQTRNVFKAPGVGAVTVEGYPPSLDVALAIGFGEATLEGFAPTVEQTANQWIDAGAGTLTVEGFAPSLAESTINAPVPGTATLTVEGFAPNVAVNGAVAIGLGEITAEGFAPNVAQTIETILFAGAGALTAEGFAPSVAATESQWIVFGTPDDYQLGGYAPELLQQGSFNISLTPGALTLEGFSPEIGPTRKRTEAGGKKRRRRVIIDDRKPEEEQVEPEEQAEPAKPPKKAKRKGKAAPVEAPEPQPIDDTKRVERDRKRRDAYEAERETDLIINALALRQENNELQMILDALADQDRMRREKLNNLIRSVESLVDPDQDEEALILLMMMAAQ